MATCGMNSGGGGSPFEDIDPVRIFGLIALGFVAFKATLCMVKLFYMRCLASPVDLSRWRGCWGIVTGATDGIGKAYARAIANHGINIVLVSRTQSKLDDVAKELGDEFGVEVKTVVVDFVNDDARQYKIKIASSIEGLDIRILVNNVGMSYSLPAKFLEIDGGTDDQCEKLVKCNIESVNSMTSLILPQMVERHSGAVINLSSLSAGTLCPLLTVYAATKAYVDYFTRGLAMEYESQGVTVQCVMPGYVVSKMSKIRKANMIAPMPDQFVKSALARLGIESRTTGYWVHDLMLYGQTRLLPSWIADWVTFKQLAKIRIRALKKQAKSEKEKKTE